MGSKSRFLSLLCISLTAFSAFSLNYSLAITDITLPVALTDIRPSRRFLGIPYKGRAVAQSRFRLRFAGSLAREQDEILYTADGGQTWTVVYRGAIDTLYQPENVDFTTVASQVPRRVTVSRKAEYELRVEHNSIWIQSGGNFVMVFGTDQGPMENATITIPLRSDELGLTDTFRMSFYNDLRFRKIQYDGRSFILFSLSSPEFKRSKTYLAELGKKTLVPLVDWFENTPIHYQQNGHELLLADLERIVDLRHLEAEARVMPLDHLNYEWNRVDVNLQQKVGTTRAQGGGFLGNLFYDGADPLAAERRYHEYLQGLIRRQLPSLSLEEPQVRATITPRELKPDRSPVRSGAPFEIVPLAPVETWSELDYKIAQLENLFWDSHPDHRTELMTPEEIEANRAKANELIHAIQELRKRCETEIIGAS